MCFVCEKLHEVDCVTLVRVEAIYIPVDIDVIGVNSAALFRSRCRDSVLHDSANLDAARVEPKFVPISTAVVAAVVTVSESGVEASDITAVGFATSSRKVTNEILASSKDTVERSVIAVNVYIVDIDAVVCAGCDICVVL